MTLSSFKSITAARYSDIIYELSIVILWRNHLLRWSSGSQNINSNSCALNNIAAFSAEMVWSSVNKVSQSKTNILFHFISFIVDKLNTLLFN
jgi:hypothetical protein